MSNIRHKGTVRAALLIAFGLMGGAVAYAQPYTSWRVGNAQDTLTTPRGGLLLAGGGGDNDDAMRWFLQRAQGGDVVVLRASGGQGYNAYLYAELGATVNSVETLRVPSLAAAQDPYVYQRLLQAEAVFIAGGNQTDYHDYWRNTPVMTALQYLLTEKKAVVGGTSAGMAILGESYYAPTALGITSAEALSDPFHPYTAGLYADGFLTAPFLSRTITDTHFDDRNRAGRLTTLLARLHHDHTADFYAIACNDYTAVAIDTNGLAAVYGQSDQYPDFAYFVQSHCQWPLSAPDTCQPGQPLTWQRGLRVYRVGGTPAGSHTFDLNDWQTGNGGIWQHWGAQQGALLVEPDTLPDCTPLALARTHPLPTATVSPQPVRDRAAIRWPTPLVDTGTLTIYDAQGRPCLRRADVRGQSCTLTGLRLPAGSYTFVVEDAAGPKARGRLLVQ